MYTYLPPFCRRDVQHQLHTCRTPSTQPPIRHPAHPGSAGFVRIHTYHTCVHILRAYSYTYTRADSFRTPIWGVFRLLPTPEMTRNGPHLEPAGIHHPTAPPPPHILNTHYPYARVSPYISSVHNTHPTPTGSVLSSYCIRCNTIYMYLLYDVYIYTMPPWDAGYQLFRIR